MSIMIWIASIFGIITGLWVFVRHLFVLTIRLDAKLFKVIYEFSKNQNDKFIISEEFIIDKKYPNEFKAICWFPKTPWFYINHGERLLTAGWQGKDSIVTMTCLRWKYKNLKYFLIELNENIDLGVSVEILTPNYVDYIGSIKVKTPEPILSPSIWRDIDIEASEVFSGVRKKSGALLYGDPGNGKTSMIRYLATKYNVSIQIITFNPDYTNQDIMTMFSNIGEKCIVLFEDFDNYFDGRKCILGSDNKSIKFTFDVILNGLDGIYNSYEQVFFIMTVNDIGKVDNALKQRPSRFKYMRKFGNPDLETRLKLLPLEWASASDNMNLDQIFRLKEFYESGLSINQAKDNLGQIPEVDNFTLDIII